ncbi:hypothetical protein CDD82_6173 [Ophiocordyceps australis]|uniref:Uncharacterized protein n=1 Tax=Ophiocordyceps australis TaxID=1399860 RepID=A0A2C5XH06_9HYPO|nr:hypothetical protein CDD82_6173 [Ophiocordyceps australis]
MEMPPTYEVQQLLDRYRPYLWAPAQNLEVQIHRPFTRISERKWFEGLSRDLVYKITVESFKLRILQELEVSKEECPPPKVLKARYRRFLDTADLCQYLPPWWQFDTAWRLSKRFKHEEPNGWYSMSRFHTVHELQVVYGDALFVCQLQYFAAVIECGYIPGSDTEEIARCGILAEKTIEADNFHLPRRR